MISRLIYDENNKKKEKIYGEANNPNTVKVNNGTDLMPNSFIIGVKDTRNVKVLPSKTSSLVMTNGAGEVYLEPYHTKQNQLVGTDTNGNFHFFPRRDYPLTPPNKKQELVTINGSYTPSGVIGTKTITFDEPGWYEITVTGAGGGGGGAGIYYDNVQYRRNAGFGGSGGGVTFRIVVTANDALTSVNGAYAVVKRNSSFQLRAGCSGGGGKGIRASTAAGPNGVTYNVRGGDGGRSPIVYDGRGGNGGDFIGGDTATMNALNAGGRGINNGANGGNSQFKPGTGTKGYSASGGGGANGQYGGDGGSSIVINTKTGVIVPLMAGAGGGAGGGVGLGGRGGCNIKSGVLMSGGISYGGGGGGDGYNLSGPSPTSASGLAVTGGGGGGGGASYVSGPTIGGSLFVVAGGGGGGAGGGSGMFDSTDNSLTGGYYGTTNITYGTSGTTSLIGGSGGAGASGQLATNIEKAGYSYDLYGSVGVPGMVKVVKLYD